MDIAELQESLLADVAGAETMAALEDVRVSALGKKGRITAEMKNLGQLEPEQRRPLHHRAPTRCRAPEHSDLGES